MGNKASLSYCSVCYDGRYYSEDIMSDDIDAIIHKDDYSKHREATAAHNLTSTSKDWSPPQQQHLDNSSTTAVQSGSFGSANDDLLPSTSPRRRAVVVSEQLMRNQLSFSSQLSMEGRELCINKRAASTCEREDVEDNVAIHRSESSVLMPEDDDEAEEPDRISEQRESSD